MSSPSTLPVGPGRSRVTDSSASGGVVDDAATPHVLLPDFHTLPELIAAHAQARPQALALVCDGQSMSYAALDALMDRVATALQRDGHRPGAVLALCAAPSTAYLAVFLGALRAGLTVAPLATSATPAQLAGMLADAQAALLFVDQAQAQELEPLWQQARAPDPAPCPDSATAAVASVRRIRLDDSTSDRPSDRPSASTCNSQGPSAGGQDTALRHWLAAAGSRPQAVPIAPLAPFNLIYSSGTTGQPKGIVQSHAMRWAQVRRAAAGGYGPDAVTLVATPLYSNTTLVVVVPTLAGGGCVLLCPRFECARYLSLAQQQRATHTMLVPVQYQRLMDWPEFDAYDLSSFRFKACTSAPFAAELKAQVLRRWPGALAEYYGLTEGGGTTILYARRHPDKLHTVGQPAEGHDIRLIDEAGRELPRGPSSVGEVVGRSPAMMNGYHRQPERSRAAEWFDAAGRRFLRSGDIGRFDEDGFLILLDRRKDLVISGGFNIYPSDLEAVLRQHAAVAEAAVVGVPSARWGETPVAFVVRRAGHADSAVALRAWLNGRVGRTQRLADLLCIDALPRNAIGKVQRRDLQAAYALHAQQALSAPASPPLPAAPDGPVPNPGPNP